MTRTSCWGTVKGKLLNIYMRRKEIFWLDCLSVRLPVGYDHVFWDYFWGVYRDREPARTDNSVWEIGPFFVDWQFDKSVAIWPLTVNELLVPSCTFTSVSFTAFVTICCTCWTTDFILSVYKQHQWLIWPQSK